ncbi:DUF3107 domain-containing protein [Tessaracoccus antarcticus]|uniref:DUF3107 domain-containing protein n=1 Tax=Tessaracoccus antarcticus TaxID=2479848 RepID=A0A3M0G4W8_9ACTN|nr:DUF3107 domain-containing protein [Tessaracoccus antarcticus]RMB60060.1 DUF3107 domain-containing protein [Tessaracoccus antarcticus]
MEVRIGVSDVAREVTLRTESSADDLIEKLSRAVADNTLFEVVDLQGRRVVVPAAKVAYLDLGSSDVRAVGFGAV